MPKNFKDLIAKMPLERQMRAKAKAEQMMSQIKIAEIQKIKTRTNGVSKTLKENKNN